MSTPPRRHRAKKGEQKASDWINSLSAVVPILWFCLALLAFYRFAPLAEEAIEKGKIDKIRIWEIEVELATVPLTRPPENAQTLAAAADLISTKNRERISARFAQMSKQLVGANILWVDDQHPYPNVRERRVLTAAGVNIDLAKSTKEAINWLSRSSYDALITDAYRKHQKMADCQSQQVKPSAGCDLLRKVGDCYQENRREPQLVGDDPNTRQSNTDPNTRQSNTDPNTRQSNTDPNTRQSNTDPNTRQSNTDPNTRQSNTEDLRPRASSGKDKQPQPSNPLESQGNAHCVAIKAQSHELPLMIVYSGHYDPLNGKPPYAFGMTNRADDLFDLVLDSLARRPIRDGAAPSAPIPKA
jgi:hypothetical protein